MFEKILKINSKNLFSQKIQLTLDFYISRFDRLYPALLFTISIFLPVLLITINTKTLPNTLNQSLASLTGIGNIGAYKFGGNYFTGTGNPFIHMWSLGVETQIYIILPLIIILIPNCSFERIIKLYLFLSVFSSISFLFPQYLKFPLENLQVNNLESFNFYSTSSRIW